MIGRWSDFYARGGGGSSDGPRGDATTYRMAEAYLGGLAVEDWGCGIGVFRGFHRGPYRGIDGTRTPACDEVADLATYEPAVAPEGILLRHVIEHNPAWEAVLENAVRRFSRRMCLITHTPCDVEKVTVLRSVRYGEHEIPDLAIPATEIDRCVRRAAPRVRVAVGNHRGAYPERLLYLSKET